MENGPKLDRGKNGKKMAKKWKNNGKLPQKSIFCHFCLPFLPLSSLGPFSISISIFFFHFRLLAVCHAIPARQDPNTREHPPKPPFWETTLLRTPELSEDRTAILGNLNTQACDSPDPRQGPESPFPGKEDFGVQKTPIPSPLQRVEKGVSVQKSPFSMCSLVEKKGILRQKTPFSRTRGNGGFWTPKPSFPGNGDSGPCLGSGASQHKARSGLLRTLCGSQKAVPCTWCTDQS